MSTWRKAMIYLGLGPDDEYDDGSGEMRGVHARSYIPPHTVCVSIPKSCLITVEMGQSTPVGRKVLSGDLDLDAPKHIFLMIYLLWDMKVHGDASFFAFGIAGAVSVDAADVAGTIGYEILTSLGPRYARRYLEQRHGVSG